MFIFCRDNDTQGIYHDMLGMAMLPLAFSLYGFLAWFMSSLFYEDSKKVYGDIIIRSKEV